MATEIERKFLLRNEQWQSGVVRTRHIVQGYLAVNDQCGIRVRIADDVATLNVKSAGLDITRHEYEYPIPIGDAQEMLHNLCAGRVVEKTRYCVEHGSRLWEIDVFEGRNSGLVVAEIELNSAEEEVDRPGWIGAEVSGQARFMNNQLADHPFELWDPQERVR